MKTYSGYSLHDVKKSNSRIIYWILLEESLEFKHKGYTTWTNFLEAKTVKKAFKLARKYNAYRIERLIDSDIGRWCIGYYQIKKENK